jgi:hypothetical protein
LNKRREKARWHSGRTDRGALVVAAVVVAARVLYAIVTRYVLDDAFITARYGRNLAEGLGFVFNAGEASYGFTSPLWVLLAAVGSLLNLPPHAWLAGWAIAFDALTAYLAARLISSNPGRVAVAALLACWPVLNASSVGGMETSLLGFLAMAWWSRHRPGAAAAIAPLVRPEGWLLPLVHLIRERKPVAFAVWAPGVLWLVLAWVLFGSPLPLSAEAKPFVYGGPSVGKAISWIYHLGQMPVFMFAPIKTAMVVASLSFWLLVMACSPGGRGWGLILALAWMGFLVLAGAPIFEWYLALPSILLIVSACRSRILERWKIAAAAIALNAAFLLVWGMQDGQAQRRLGNLTWIDASRYVAGLRGVESVYAEAVGVLGWEFRGVVYDEVGIVTPGMSKYREGGDGWYFRSILDLKPDALIVRPYFLYRNEALAGEDRPFVSQQQFDELSLEYVEVAEFADTVSYATPRMSQVRVLVRHEVAQDLRLTPLGDR